jgi:hypothetical protein
VDLPTPSAVVDVLEMGVYFDSPHSKLLEVTFSNCWDENDEGRKSRRGPFSTSLALDLIDRIPVEEMDNFRLLA